jgi:tripartite-type tricarboxylate transporter receptor subunit TctC
MKSVALTGIAILLLQGGAALAQGFPNKPIRMIAGSEPGGPVDTLARLVAAAMSEGLGQSVPVENRTGAGGSIGAEYVARAAPDGYTILLASPAAISIGPHLNPAIRYDPIKDFAPVSNIGVSYFVLVVNPQAVPSATLKEFIEWAKARPGKLSYGSAGNGTVTQLGAVLLNSLAGIKAEHIPYKGGGPALADLVAGRTQYMIAPEVASSPLIKAGKLRVLGVTGPRRSSLSPQVPTIAESGFKNYDISSWYGVFAPGGTPQTVVARLNAPIVKHMKSPQTRDKMAGMGLEALGSTPEEFAQTIRAESPMYAKIIKEAGVKIE